MLTRLKIRLVAALVVAVGLGAYALKDSAMVDRLMAWLPAGSTAVVGGPELKTPEQAGLHKCRSGGRITYSDQACAPGTQEEGIRNGSVNVVTMPKAPPASAASAASGAGRGLVKGFDRETIDRLRDRQVDDAANR